MRAIRDASEHVGFFYIKDHGVPSADMTAIFTACDASSRPRRPERDTIYLVNSPHYRGYLPIGVLSSNTESAARPAQIAQCRHGARA